MCNHDRTLQVNKITHIMYVSEWGGGGGGSRNVQSRQKHCNNASQHNFEMCYNF